MRFDYKRKWNTFKFSIFRGLKKKRKRKQRWKEEDLYKYHKKSNKLTKTMQKRYEKITKKNQSPYCPRCEARKWDCSSATDEHDTYEMMKCEYCGFTFSPTHD